MKETKTLSRKGREREKERERERERYWREKDRVVNFFFVFIFTIIHDLNFFILFKEFSRMCIKINRP